MKGFSLPNISIPKISIPNISIGGTEINTGSLKSAIESAIPDLSSITSSLDIEGLASQVMNDNLSGGIEIPSELKDLISK